MNVNIIVSACLLGMCCRYDGQSKPRKEIIKLKEKYNLIAVCPEIFGGLATPRASAERRGDKVVTKGGGDVTAEYIKGAEETLYLASLFNCKFAVLKERSPSCGFGEVYDGTFSGTLRKGHGVTAELLSKNGIKVFGESEIYSIIEELEKK